MSSRGLRRGISVIPLEGEAFVTPGEYYVDVHGYEAPAGAATFRLFVWTVGAERGNATVSAPSSVSAGTDETLALNCRAGGGCIWVSLRIRDGATALDQTVIEITAP